MRKLFDFKIDLVLLYIAGRIFLRVSFEFQSKMPHSTTYKITISN